MVNQGDSQQMNATSARLVDSLKCELSVKESMLEHASSIVELEKNKISVVAKDSKAVLNSLLEDIQQVCMLVGRWLVGCGGCIRVLYILQRHVVINTLHIYIRLCRLVRLELEKCRG